MKKIIINTFLTYLRVCAKLQLKKIHPYIIGISGSAGKTSTMQAVYAILKDYKNCKISKKANSHTGIPLDILNLHPSNFTYKEWLKLTIQCIWQLITDWEKYDIYIVELGVDALDEPKNMAYLLKILVPDIAIYLNVNSIHGENYEHVLKVDKLLLSSPKVKNDYLEQVKDLIAKDKNLLIQSLPKEGLAILNTDDTRVKQSKDLTKATVYELKEIPINEAKMIGEDDKLEKLIKKSVKENTKIYYSNTRNEGGFAFDIIINSKKYTVNFPTLVLPKHYSVTFASALSIAHFLNIDMDSAIESLVKNFVLESGRSTLFRGIANSIVIDSSYNSSKEVCMDLIELINSYTIPATSNSPKEVYKIVVLGDMRELGNNARIEHEDLASFAFNKADEFFLIGKEMKNYFIPRLLELGVNKYKIHWFEKAGECAKVLKNFLRAYFSKDEKNLEIDEFYKKYLEKQKFDKEYTPIVLVKGSQNTIFLEIVVEELLENKADINMLCRRGKFWDKQREKYK